MRKFQFYVLLGVLLIFSACKEDDTTPSNLDENTIYFNGAAYYVSNNLTIIKNEEYEFALKVTMRGSYMEDADNSDSVINGLKSFYSYCLLIPNDSTSILGTYLMVDKNGDGIVNELDASGGYCPLVSLEMDESYFFYDGEFTLDETEERTITYYDENGNGPFTTNGKGLIFQFSVETLNGQTLTGNVILADNRD